MSPRWNWDSPTPLAASECALPPDQRVGGGAGGAHSPATKEVGESQFQRLEKRLAAYSVNRRNESQDGQYNRDTSESGDAYVLVSSCRCCCLHYCC
jgi:hypothetical protein